MTTLSAAVFVGLALATRYLRVSMSAGNVPQLVPICSVLPNSLLVIVAVMVSVVAQPIARAHERVGDIASVLSDAEADEVIRVSACGAAAPWLLNGSRGQAVDVQFVEVFCAPDAVSVSVRLGALAWVIRRSTNAGWSPWSLQTTHRYAQLVETGGSIRIHGTVGDEDLVRIVKFLRESPSKVGGRERDRVEGTWPVTRVSQQPEGTITARVSKDLWESQEVGLRRTTHGWEVMSVSYGIV